VISPKGRLNGGGSGFGEERGSGGNKERKKGRTEGGKKEMNNGENQREGGAGYGRVQSELPPNADVMWK